MKPRYLGDYYCVEGPEKVLLQWVEEDGCREATFSRAVWDRIKNALRTSMPLLVEPMDAIYCSVTPEPDVKGGN